MDWKEKVINQYEVGTNIFKMFDGKEYARKVVSYDSNSKLYNIKLDGKQLLFFMMY